MAAETTVDLIINQRSSFQVTFFIKEDGAVKDLTGFTTAAKLKNDFQTLDSQAISFATSANTTTGGVTISLTPEQTANLGLQRYVYDMSITSPTGFKTRMVEGSVRVSGGVS